MSRLPGSPLRPWSLRRLRVHHTARTLLLCAALCSAGVLLWHPWARRRDSLREDERGLLHDLVYLADDAADARLGCPPGYGCFYRFDASAGALPVSRDPVAAPQAACTRVLRNCFKWGECFKRRDWCVRRGRMPAWLARQYPSFHTEEAVAYLFGRPDVSYTFGGAPNPTHMACLHYLPLARWLRATGLARQQIVMVWDEERGVGPGEYGEGLAAPLGRTVWLPQLERPVLFRRIKMGEAGLGRFPYHLLKHELSTREDPAFIDLAARVKRHLGLNDTFAARPKVVIPVRRHTRVLTNAAALAARLRSEGLLPRVVDFAAMSFPKQVRLMHDAAALVTLHGADEMNLMFLPPRGAVVEIAPVHWAYGFRKVLRKGDYFNLARMLGKYHLEFVNPRNSTWLTAPDGSPADWNDVKIVKAVEVDVERLVPVVKAAVMMACGRCLDPCGPLNEKGEERCIPDPPPGRKVDWRNIGYIDKVEAEDQQLRQQQQQQAERRGAASGRAS